MVGAEPARVLPAAGWVRGWPYSVAATDAEVRNRRDEEPV